MPMTCLVSVIGEQKSMMGPMHSFLRKRHGLDSDGAVPPHDAHFAGADYVKLTGLDHGGTVFQKGRRVEHRDDKLQGETDDPLVI